MSGGWNERFEVRRQWISWPRADDVGKFLRRICAIDRRHLQELERMGQRAGALQPAIHWARLSKSQFLDPAGNFTLVVSRLLLAALGRYPRGLTGHVAVPNRSILR